jgi:hypothetical protein
MAVRSDRCRICLSVTYIEDVNARMFDADLEQVRDIRPALDYARSCGMAGTDRSIRRHLRGHAAHVAAFMAGVPVAPAAGRIQRVSVGDGPREWLQVNQQAMDVGFEALRGLNGRLAAGQLEPREEIELAKLGLAAAHKRGDHLTRGKVLRDAAEDLLRLASGLDDEAAG